MVTVRFIKHFVTMVTFVTIVSPTLVAQPSATAGDIYNHPVDSVDEALVERIKENRLSWQFGLTFLTINPQDSLRRTIQSMGLPGTGYGFSFDVSYYLDPIPVAFGGDVGVTFYGESQRSFTQRSGPFIDTLTYKAQNTQVPLHLFLRLQPNMYTWVFPYAEVVGGVTFIGSSLDISRSNGFTQSADTKAEGDATWQYGVGCGAMVKLVDFVTLPTQLQRMLLHVRMRYLWGSSTSVAAFQINENLSTPVIEQPVPSTRIVHFAIGLEGQF